MSDLSVKMTMQEQSISSLDKAQRDKLLYWRDHFEIEFKNDVMLKVAAVMAIDLIDYEMEQEDVRR